MRLLKFILVLIFVLVFASCNNNSPNQPDSNSGVPNVKILSPADNSTITNNVLIQAEASDDKGVVMVEIFIDGNMVKGIVIPPYVYDWDVSAQSDSSLHIIYAKAYDADDNVSSSEIINVTVRRLPPPTNFTTNFISDEKLILQWNYIYSNDMTFIIEESVNGSVYRPKLETGRGVTDTEINQAFYKDSIYAYRVKAKLDSLLSQPSAVVNSQIIIPSPGYITHTKVNTNSVKISWQDKCNFESGYLVEKKEEDGSFNFLATLTSNSTEYIDNDYDGTVITTYSIKTITNHNKSLPATITIYSGPPTISGSVVEPDTLTVTSTQLIQTSIIADHPNGLSQIDDVYILVFGPNNAFTGNTIIMFDDGDGSLHGDLVAGDGIYSRLIEVTATNTKGTYRFEFRAKALNGELSNIINHYVVIN